MKTGKRFLVFLMSFGLLFCGACGSTNSQEKPNASGNPDASQEAGGQPIDEPAQSTTPTTSGNKDKNNPTPALHQRARDSIEPPPEGTPVLTPKNSPTESR